MPPIPIHTASPINTKTSKQQLPSSTSPSSPSSFSSTHFTTANPSTPYSPTTTNDDSSTAPPTTTTAAGQPQPYLAARPAATPAYPAPTSTAANTYTPHAALPTPTRTTQPPAYDGPPMPQPGAVPDVNMLPSNTATSLPPPPRAGEKRDLLTPRDDGVSEPSSIQPPPAVTMMPPQLGIPPPATNYAPTHSTATSTSPSYAPPNLFGSSSSPQQQQHHQRTPSTHTWMPPSDGTAASAEDPRRISLEHPPGYMQNPRAADMTAAQRAAQEMQERENNSTGGGFAGVMQGVVGEGGLLGSSIGGGSAGSGGVVGGGEGTGAWDSAKKWLGGVAEMVGEAEGEIWRRVGGAGK